MTTHVKAKAPADAVDGDIVVGRPDAAGRENVVESFGKGRHFVADELYFILNRRNLLHFNAQLTKFGAEKMRVDILCFSRQDLVADDDDTGGFRHDIYFLAQSNSHGQCSKPNKIAQRSNSL